MNKEEKIEQLKFAIDRYDHYYDSINNKGNVYLTLNTFLLGGTITGYYALGSTEGLNCFCHFLVWLSLVINITAIALALLAIKPYITNSAKKSARSLLFFGDVSSFNLSDFISKYDTLSIHDLYEDLVKQVHLLASGLSKKYKLLYWATVCIALQFFCIIVIGFFILK